MIPNIVHFVVPKDVPNEMVEIINIAKKLHPGWEIKIWGDRDGVEGARLNRFLDKAKNGAQRADLIKYEAVYTFGGIYIDADMRLLRSFDQLLRYDTLMTCSEDGAHISCGFFAAPPRHEALNAVIGSLIRDEPEWTRPQNETTGPHFFTSVLGSRADVTMLPRETFYPYYSGEPRPKVFPAACIGIHEWAGAWVDKKIISKSPPRRGLSRLLKATAKKLLPQVQRGVALALPDSLTEALRFKANSYSCGRDLIALTRRNLKMALPVSDLNVTPTVALAGEFQPGTESFVAATVRGGDWVIDVGTCFGYFAMIAAARCGPFGRIFIVDAKAESHPYIEKSLQLNGFHDRARLLTFAAPASADERLVESAQEGIGSSRGAAGASEASSCEPSSVELRTKSQKEVCVESLDDEFPIDVPIKLLRIDVEGLELRVLRGARRLLMTRSIQYLMLKTSKGEIGSGSRELRSELLSIWTAGYDTGILLTNGAIKPLEDFSRELPYLGRVILIFSARWDVRP
jgi:FkbM family methyltransferase